MMISRTCLKAEVGEKLVSLELSLFNKIFTGDVKVSKMLNAPTFSLRLLVRHCALHSPYK